MAVLTEERKKYENLHIGDIVRGWKVIDANTKTQKVIIECTKCGLIKEISYTTVIPSSVKGKNNSSVAPCLCPGITEWNNEPIVCNTDIQKQALEMLKAEKTYAEVGSALGMTRQAVGSLVKTMRTNYQKYLKQLEKSNDLKANRE